MLLKQLLLYFVSWWFSLHDAENNIEGTPCIRDGYNGTCIAYHKCLSVLKDKLEGKQTPICGVDGTEPIICCTECQQYHEQNVSQFVFNKEVGLLVKNGNKSHDACIDYLDKLPYECKYGAKSYIKKVWNNNSLCHDVYMISIRPSGGQDVRRGQYPYMALLGYGEDPNTEWLCAGSLISEKFILTAAHCSSTTKLGPIRFAALGILKRSDPVEIWEQYNIKRIITHPEYKSPFKYHDIALLETKETVKFHENVLPICLDSKNLYKTLRDRAYALGWGALGPGQALADVLQKITIHKFTDAECYDFYPEHRLLRHGFDNETQMCYGDPEKNTEGYTQDTCRGDSGGPLSVRTNNIGCLPSIIGITSYGAECGYQGSAGVYTRVLHYVPWIESIVWP